MKQVSNENPEILKKDISVIIENITSKNNLKLSENGSYTVKFGELIEKLSMKENKVNDLEYLDKDIPTLKSIKNWIFWLEKY